jgi:hypothetical protein
MFHRTLAAVVTAASLVPNQSAMFVGYDLESDEERTRRQNLRVDAAHAPSPPTTTDQPDTTDAAA